MATERSITEFPLDPLLNPAVINRGRTAMRRYRCSKPVAIALADGIISRATSVFDYGCGHGADVRYLTSKRIRASGWDPQYQRREPPRSAEIVNLGYVLNVIESTAERLETLRKAFALAKQALVVSVRVDRALEEVSEFGDGYLTTVGTFQKLFSQTEFREYLESGLRRRAYLIAPGIAYVFKADEVEAHYLATKAFTRRFEYRTDLIEDFENDSMARRYVRLADRLGRLPTPEEFKDYQKLLVKFGSLQRLERLTLRLVDRDAFEGSRAQRRDDLMTYVAMLRLQGLIPPPFHALPPDLRNDIKGIWRSYREALGEGDRFLFSMGNPKAVQAACAGSPVGKLLPQDFYAHKSAEDGLPALLRLLIFAAKQVVGDLSYDLAKISTDGRAVSFLYYLDFDSDAHPRLLRSVRVYLPKAAFGVRDYGRSTNPPILHRKELFVPKDHPRFEEFRRLTEQEEAAGLLSNSGIGFRNEWELLLETQNLQILDHRLHKVRSEA